QKAATSQRLTPILEFAQHLSAIAALAVDDAGAKAVLGPYFILGDDVLKIPCRVGGLLAIVDAAAAGRMGEANAVAALKHDDVSLLLEEAVVERLVEAERREVLVQRVAQAGTELELKLVAAMPDCALVVMPLCAELLPEPAAAEVDALIFGSVDVA